MSDDPLLPSVYNMPHGVELNELQVWVDPGDGTVVIQAPAGVSQVTFTPAQWRKLVEFVGQGEEPSPTL